MSFLGFIVALLVLASFFGFVNARWFHWPPSIGMLTAGLMASVMTVIFGQWRVAAPASHALVDSLQRFDFSTLLLHGFVPVLLFTGGLHIDLDRLKKCRGPVAALSIAGTLISTFVIGYATYGLLCLFQLPASMMECFLFGALISPTDPIAVLGILRFYNVPERLEVLIAGESLFNDGVGILIFTTFLEGLRSGHSSPYVILSLFLQQAAGGILLGATLGFIAYQAIKRIDEVNSEILITVALVASVGWLSIRLNVSGALSALAAGLLIGNPARRLGMSDRTRQGLEIIWSFIDHALNTVLFLILGLEVLAIHFNLKNSWIFLGIILIVLLGRALSVVSMMGFPSLRRQLQFPAFPLLVWGGLRGGIPVALALSLPAGAAYAFILQATYAVVIFSILVQGHTFEPFMRRLKQPDASPR